MERAQEILNTSKRGVFVTHPWVQMQPIEWLSHSHRNKRCLCLFYMSWKNPDEGKKYSSKQHNWLRNERLITYSNFDGAEVFFLFICRKPHCAFQHSCCFFEVIKHMNRRSSVSHCDNGCSTDVKLPVWNNKTDFVYRNANCKLKVIVIQLSFSFLCGETISCDIPFSAFSIAFCVSLPPTGSYLELIIFGLYKFSCKSCIVARLIHSCPLWVRNQFAGLEFH